MIDFFLFSFFSFFLSSSSFPLPDLIHTTPHQKERKRDVKKKPKKPKKLTISPTFCLNFPPQCLNPVLRYSSLGSSFILVLRPSHPWSPNSCLTGERDRLMGLRIGLTGLSKGIAVGIMVKVVGGMMGLGQGGGE